MKKRLLSLVLCLVMVFSLFPSFAMAADPEPAASEKGVYAVFGESPNTQPARATYKFIAHGAPYQFNNDKGVATDQQILVNGDALYDVGEPMPNAHETFDGWYVGDQKVEFGKPMTVTANGVVQVVARFTELHTVTFYADADKHVVLTVKEVAKNASLPIDGLEAPVVSATNDFAYWTTDGTDQYAANGTVENIVDDVELVPVFSTGAWLSFSANGGSYNAPKFIVGGVVNVGDTLTPPTRAGYSFDGWYDGDTKITGGDGKAIVSLTVPAEGKTLTAKWTGQNVNYTVAYWWENPDGSGYSLANKVNNLEPIVTKQGTAGAQARYDDRSSQYKNEHFTLNTEKTAQAETTIAGDGTTLRNVFFDRDQFTLTFIDPDEESTITYYYSSRTRTTSIDDPVESDYISTLESNRKSISGYYVSYYETGGWLSSTYYAIKVDGTWYWIDSNGSYVYNASRIDSVDMAEPITTITARHGENISDYFPIEGYDGYVWTPQNSSIYTSGDVPFIESMKPENTIFQARRYGTGTTNHLYYYIEATGQEGSDVITVQYDGKTYVEHQHVKISANGGTSSTKSEDVAAIDGYEFKASDPAYGSDGRVSLAKQNNSNYYIKFYYARAEYDLKFITNGGPDVVLPNNPPVKYEMPMAGYKPANYEIGVTTKDVDGKTMVFQGWYDNPVFEGKPYDFDNETMPAKNLALYANWAPKYYRIDIDPNGGELSATEATFTWKTAEGGEENRIKRYDDVTRNYVEDDNGTHYYEYHYYGCVSVEDSERSLSSARVARYVPVSDTPSGYTNTEQKYTYEEGAYSLIGWYIESADGRRTACPPEMEITGPTKLVAEWRRSGEFTVKYDGGAHGTVTVPDNKKYVDQAETVAAVAPEANEGWVFTGWLLNDVTYVPGDTFVVDANQANENREITLVAQYRPANEPGVVPTAEIVWHANNGTDASVTDEAALNVDVAIRAAGTFDYANHVFLGWAKTADAAEDELFLKATDNGFEAKNGSNWQATSFVATNSTTENNDLYAVWEEITPSTILIDYNVPVTLTTTLDDSKDITINDAAAAFDANGKQDGNSGYYTKADTTLSYKLDDVVINPKTGANALDAETHKSTTSTDTYDVTIRAFDGVDKALFHDGSWKSVTTVPATSVYYSDNQADVTLDKNGDGFNAGIVTDAERFDTGNKGKQVYYTFTGTGIDVYSTTDQTMKGQILAQLFDKDGNKVDSLSMKNYSPAERHNVPTIFFHDKPYGEYTLRLYVAKGLNYRIDGIRVYNPTGFGEGHQDAQAEKAYADYSEQNAAFTNLRDLLLTDPTNVTVNGGVAIFSDTKLAEGQTQKTVTVPVLNDDGTQKVDQDGKLVTEEVAYQPHTLKAYEIDGPKNEVYLDAGDAIAFTITNWATYKDKGVKLMMGVHKLKDDATFSVNSGANQNAPEVDQYYDVTPADGSNKVMVANTSETEGVLISVTNIKVSGGESALAVKASGDLGAKALSVTDEAEENALFVAVDEEAIAYASEFNGRRIKAAVEAQMVVPETPDEPEVPQQPTIQDVIRDLLSSFVNALFGSISRLFGH